MIKISIFAVCLSQIISGLPLESKWDQRLIGGSPAADGEAPYHVLLMSAGNAHFCSGSIISKKTVLTTANCLYKRTPFNTIVVTGTNNVYGQGGDRYTAWRLLIHGDYNPTTHANDIALIILDREMEFSDKVQMIDYSKDYIDDDGIKVTATGWGSTERPPDSNLPNDLQIMALLVLNNAECKWTMPGNPIYPSQICTYNKIGEGTCSGDAGGPLVYDGKVIGIISWNIPCAKGNPDVHTRISSFSDWIDEHKA